MSMRIGIVNDLALAREALRRVVTSVPGYSVAWDGRGWRGRQTRLLYYDGRG